MARRLILYREKTIKLKVHKMLRLVICVGIISALETRQKKRWRKEKRGRKKQAGMPVSNSLYIHGMITGTCCMVIELALNRDSLKLTIFTRYSPQLCLSNINLSTKSKDVTTAYQVVVEKYLHSSCDERFELVFFWFDVIYLHSVSLSYVRRPVCLLTARLR